MRNLLGRLHARRLPELLRIADAWGVPLHVESKGEVVAALYRAMTDPRTVRDLWDRLTPDERAVATAMAGAPDGSAAPTVGELAARIGTAEEAARETALGLFRAGVLSREGDDEPLPIGESPRLLMPREVALNIRRIEDEKAAGDLAQAPLRVLLALLDDAELENAARIWGLRALPGVARRQDLTSRLLRLVNDRERRERVVRTRGRDAAAIWRIVHDAPGQVEVAAVAAKAGLARDDPASGARLRAALAELEGSLLVWHAYRADGTRWLFIPQEIRNPDENAPVTLTALNEAALAAHDVVPWRHPDAVAWDLLTLLRIVTDAQSPTWDAAQPPPRWLGRAAARRLWFGGRDGVPPGYLELLQALGMAEGVLAIDDDARPPRMVAGPQARAWRGRRFPDQTARLRDQWLRLPRWIEGAPAGIVDVWGADWRGMRPRLLMALGDPEISAAAGVWVTLESLAARIAARSPALLGPSFTAATARLGGEAGAGVDEDEARSAAISDVIAFELAGPFVWFGLTRTVDRHGMSRAISLTETGAALAARKPLPGDDDPGAGRAPLLVDPAGEVTLQSPSPDRVWALSAFTEPVDLGPESHYRLTSGAIGSALAAGVEPGQIVAYLERGSRLPLPSALAATLASWVKGYRGLTLQRAVVLGVDDPAERDRLLTTLRDAGWDARALEEQSLVVRLAQASEDPRDEAALQVLLRADGLAPRWLTGASEPEPLGAAVTPPAEAAAPSGDT